MDKKGANTFPFHNLPPELKKTSQRSFLCFFTFPVGYKKSRWRLMLIRNIWEHKCKREPPFQKQSVLVPTDHTYQINGKSTMSKEKKMNKKDI